MAKDQSKLKPVDAPIYGYWRALYMSFYSKNLYVDVGKRWRGFGILYLMLVIAIFCIPFAVRIGIDFDRSFKRQIITPLSMLPTIYVQKGIASLDKPMPYLIKNDKGEVVIIVDTTDSINQFTSDYPYLTILINKKTIYFRMPTPEVLGSGSGLGQGVPIAQNFEKDVNEVFDGKQLIEDNNLMGLKYISFLMIYPVIVMLFFCLLIIIFLTLAFLGQVFSRIFFSYPITFAQSSRLFMVSVTPMLLLLMITLTFNLIFPGLGFILLALLIIYFSLALGFLRSESRKLVRR